MRVWLDDIRTPPHDGWIWIKSVADAKIVIENHYRRIAVLSLDHDLGMVESETTDSGIIIADEVEAEKGAKLVLWMAETDLWPEGEIWIHSDNPVGVENMAATIRRYATRHQANIDGRTFRYVGW
jgi:hypothetical protein